MDENNLRQARALEEWVFWLKENIALPGLDEACIGSYLNHLADLGIFEEAGGGLWRLAGCEPDERVDRDGLLDRLRVLSRTEAGFSIAYFIPSPTKPPLPGFFKEPLANGEKGRTPSGNIHPFMPEKSSDLSNLQIVKKVGRQLSPFLEIEKEALSRLQGSRTGKEDAQKIFNHVMSQTREKAQPVPWQQLSRKRHK
ncbi:MAG: hypothetical protein V3U37_07945 [Nitrospinaceae bacterium]